MGNGIIFQDDDDEDETPYLDVPATPDAFLPGFSGCGTRLRSGGGAKLGTSYTQDDLR